MDKCHYCGQWVNRNIHYEDGKVFHSSHCVDFYKVHRQRVEDEMEQLKLDLDDNMFGDESWRGT